MNRFSRHVVMTYQQLDLIFPYIVFFYGALVTITLNMPQLVEIAEKRLPPQMKNQLFGHRILAVVCLVVGGLWTLQNLWLT